MWFFKKNKSKLNEEKSRVVHLNEEDILEDVILKDVIDYVVRYCDTVSVSLLMRRFKIGYNRAARCIDWLEKYKIISKRDGQNLQKVIIKDFEIIKKIITNENIVTVHNIEEMTGKEFENYSAEILKANGFEKVQVTQMSRDYGVDIIAYKDEVKYAIQCKKYSSPVGIQSVQEVLGTKTMNDCHVAVVLTNNIFTTSAKELAEKNNILLWDGNKLNELIMNYKNNK